MCLTAYTPDELSALEHESGQVRDLLGKPLDEAALPGFIQAVSELLSTFDQLVKHVRDSADLERRVAEGQDQLSQAQHDMATFKQRVINDSALLLKISKMNLAGDRRNLEAAMAAKSYLDMNPLPPGLK
jgi:hypothetical protein